MPSPDDERFEAYLKRFRPLSPDPLPASEGARPSRHTLIFWARIAVAALLLIVVLGTLELRNHFKQVSVSNAASHGASTAEVVVVRPPLTLRSANALLAAAPSFKAAVDDLAFRTRTTPLPKGKQSAVAVLSKEKIRL